VKIKVKSLILECAKYGVYAQTYCTFMLLF